MYTYCYNNPTNYSDHWGLSPHTSHICLQQSAGILIENAEPTSDFVQKFFGAGYTSEYQITSENEILPSWLCFLVSIKYGMTTTSTHASMGNTNAIMSVYAVGREDNYLLSSAGAIFNAGDNSLKLNLSMDNISFSFIERSNGSEFAGAIVLDIVNLKIGIEGSCTSPTLGAPNVTHTEYVNASFSGATVVGLILYVLTQGGYGHTFSHAYAYS